MSWPVVKLSDVAMINPRLSKDANEHQQVSFVAMASASDEGFLLSEECRVLKETKKGFTYFDAGDVLLAKITPCFENGKCLRPNQITNQIGFGSTEFHVLRAIPEKLDSMYLFYLVWSNRFRSLGEASMSGAAGQKRVSTDFLRDFEIPLPPLEEQKRIAAILDKADAIRRKRQQAIKLADDFLRSVFLEMFGDPVTNPKEWEVKTLGSHLNAIESGASPKCESRPAQSGEWGVLKLGAVSYCKYVPSENKAIFHDYEPNPNNEIKKGDFLFTRKNTHELIAASALVESTPSKMLMPDLIFRLQPKDSLNRFYLWALLTHSGMRKRVQSYASGAAGSMPNISKANLRTIEIPIPPIEEQEKFQDIYKNISTTKHKLNSSMAHIESQFFSLSQKAFSGEL